MERDSSKGNSIKIAVVIQHNYEQEKSINVNKLSNYLFCVTLITNYLSERERSNNWLHCKLRQIDWLCMPHSETQSYKKLQEKGVRYK
jgi:hypothetical protein